MKRLFRRDFRLRNLNLRVGGRCSFTTADRENKNVLAAVIDRYVLVRLEKAHFPHPFGGDAAGGEICNAAGGELDAGVRNINLVGQDRQAGGTDFFDWRIDERKHGIEVVNHQVENYVHVERAGRENAEAMDFEKHRLRDQRNGRANCGIETFEMADLGDAPGLSCELDQFVGFKERCRDGLLDQNVDSRLHELASGGEMVDCGDGDRSGVDFQRTGDQVVYRPEGVTVKFFGDSFCARKVLVDHCCQIYGFCFACKLVIDARMIATEGADTDYGHIDWLIVWQCESLKLSVQRSYEAAFFNNAI